MKFDITISIVLYKTNQVLLRQVIDSVRTCTLKFKLFLIDNSPTDDLRGMSDGPNIELAKIYHAGLKEDFIKPVLHQDFYDVYHIYNVRHPRRDELRAYLEKNNIKTEIHYPVSPNHQPAMANVFEKKAYPISERIHATTLSLPISYFHNETDIERVVDVMNRF